MSIVWILAVAASFYMLGRLEGVKDGRAFAMGFYADHLDRVASQYEADPHEPLSPLALAAALRYAAELMRPRSGSL